MSLDLLTRKHDTPSGNTRQKQKTKRSLPAWCVPAIILAGFAATFAIVLWDDLKPSVNVSTSRAIALAEDTDAGTASKTESQAPAQLLFQAAGWLEPDPLPIQIGSLINGTIKEINVVEGQIVEQGAPIATLIDDEYQIAVKQTHANHAEAASLVKLREAEIETAKAHLKTEEASLAGNKERLKRAEISYARYADLKPDTVSAQTITDAEQELREQEQVVLAAEAKILAAQTSLDEARARLESAEAVETSTAQACQKAKLDLERCVINSPIKGRILRLSSSPGARVNASGDSPDSGLIATMYDPASITLKIDVPLDQAGKLAVGQQAKIKCEVFPDRTFLGTVDRVAGEADIQRNTLQAKVKLSEPDDRLRPGMACRAEIYSPGNLPREGQAPVVAGESGESRQSVLIAPSSVIAGQDGQSSAWVISVDGKLEKRTIRLDPSKNRDNLAAVTSGILPGEPVVTNPSPDLKEGDNAQDTNPL